MSATGNVYFGNLTNQVEKEGRLNIVKSNLEQRVEELVEEDLRPLPTVLKRNRDKVCQSHDESLLQQLAEDLMAVTAGQTRQKEQNCYALQAQKVNTQLRLREVLDQLAQRRNTAGLRELLKPTSHTLKTNLQKSRGRKEADMQREQAEATSLPIDHQHSCLLG